MKFSLLFSSAIFATSIFAAPVDVEIGTTSKHSSKAHSPKVHSPEIHSTKVQSRLQSHPLIPETEASPDATGVQYSTNWAGAVLTAPPAGSTFNAISGTFTVPKPSVPSGKTGTYSGAAWIGIDGDTYSKAILQAGVQWSVDNSGGSPSYSVSAWHEWFPAPSINFGAMAVKVGDEISLSITSQSKSKGPIVMKNISSGQSLMISQKALPWSHSPTLTLSHSRMLLLELRLERPCHRRDLPSLISRKDLPSLPLLALLAIPLLSATPKWVTMDGMATRHIHFGRRFGFGFGYDGRL